MSKGKIVCFGIFLLLWSTALGEPTAQEQEWVVSLNRTALIGLPDEDWHLHWTIGALAKLYPEPPSASGLIQVRVGLTWSPSLLLAPQLQWTKATHEIGINLLNLGADPSWEIEITPFFLEFELGSPQPQRPPSGLSHQASLDLKKLVLAYLEDLRQASEQIIQDHPDLDPTTLRDPLSEFQRAFEAGEVGSASLQLNMFSVVLRLMRRADLLSQLEETHLRTGLHRLVMAFALFMEKVQDQVVKVCTGLYLSEDQRTEEVISPFVNEAVQTLTLTDRTTGAKERFTLRESKCF